MKEYKTIFATDIDSLEKKANEAAAQGYEFKSYQYGCINKTIIGNIETSNYRHFVIMEREKPEQKKKSCKFPRKCMICQCHFCGNYDKCVMVSKDAKPEIKADNLSNEYCPCDWCADAENDIPLFDLGWRIGCRNFAKRSMEEQRKVDDLE